MLYGFPLLCLKHPLLFIATLGLKGSLKRSFIRHETRSAYGRGRIIQDPAWALHDLCSATVSIGFSSIKSPVAHSHKMSQQVVLNPTRIYSFSVESSASIHESFQTNLENVLKQ